MTSLIRTSGSNVITRDGEVVALDDAAFDDVAHFRAMIADAEVLLREMREQVDERLLFDLRSRGRWTEHIEGGTVNATKAPAYVSSNQASALESRLSELLPPDVVQGLFTWVTTTRAKPGALRKLAEMTPNPDVANAITAVLPPDEDAKRVVKVEVQK